jgi:hypothetical protein
LSAFLRWSDAAFGLDLCMGIGFVHLLFLISSLFWSPEMVQMLMLVFHVLMNGSGLARFNLRISRPLLSFGTIIFILMLAPLILRTLSPCVNADSLTIYLPNVEWVVHRGLDLNPFLTGYTTMPMAAEYLFSQAYAWGGVDAVRMLDAIFGISLLVLIYRWVSARGPDYLAWMILVVLILLPGTYRYLFGNGKVDMLSCFVVLAGVMHWPAGRTYDRQTIVKSLLLFSLACAFKYTNWILLCLPMLSLLWQLIRHERSHWHFAGVLTPLAFTLPVLIRNDRLTGNPLAPLLHDPDQFVFTATHGGIPDDPLRSIASAWSMKGDLIDRLALITHDLSPFVLFSAALIFSLLLGFRSRLPLELRSQAEWLFLSLLPFYGFVSMSVQPARFLMPQLLVASLICMRSIQCLKPVSNLHTVKGVMKWGQIALLSFVLIFILYREGDWVRRYIRHLSISERQWYEETGVHHAAITIALVEDGWIADVPVVWNDRPVMSLVPYRQWDRLPTDLELHQRRSGILPLPSGDLLRFCNATSCEDNHTPASRTLIRKGPWILERHSMQ